MESVTPLSHAKGPYSKRKSRSREEEIGVDSCTRMRACERLKRKTLLLALLLHSPFFFLPERTSHLAVDARLPAAGSMGAPLSTPFEGKGKVYGQYTRAYVYEFR